MSLATTLAALSIQVTTDFEAQKRTMPDAYRDTVLLWEIGMRAFQDLEAPVDAAEQAEFAQTGGAR